MNIEKVIKKIGMFCLFGILIHPFLYSTTVLDEANSLFSSFIWAFDPSKNSHKEIPAMSLPGGTETFSVLRSTVSNQIGLIYPEIEGLGLLDYSLIPSALVSKIEEIMVQIKNKEIKKDCVSEVYVSIIAAFRLKKIPTIFSLWYSRPKAISDTQYSIRVKAYMENKVDFLFMNLSFQKENDKWLVSELTFDGTTYAKLARQN